MRAVARACMEASHRFSRCHASRYCRRYRTVNVNSKAPPIRWPHGPSLATAVAAAPSPVHVAPTGSNTAIGYGVLRKPSAGVPKYVLQPPPPPTHGPRNSISARVQYTFADARGLPLPAYPPPLPWSAANSAQRGASVSVPHAPNTSAPPTPTVTAVPLTTPSDANLPAPPATLLPVPVSRGTGNGAPGGSSTGLVPARSGSDTAGTHSTSQHASSGSEPPAPTPTPAPVPAPVTPAPVHGEGSDTTAVIQHSDTCHWCGDVGELLCCESCPTAVHVACAGLMRVPNEDWHCAECRHGKSVQVHGAHVPVFEPNGWKLCDDAVVDERECLLKVRRRAFPKSCCTGQSTVVNHAFLPGAASC